MIPSSADRRCRMTRIRTSLGDFFLCICFFCFENYIYCSELIRIINFNSIFLICVCIFLNLF
ncbi:hypothetical protein IC575_023990 [Cucumis melo]